MPVLWERELLVARNLFERRWGLEGDLSVKKDLCVPQVSRVLRAVDQAVEMEVFCLEMNAVKRCPPKAWLKRRAESSSLD